MARVVFAVVVAASLASVVVVVRTRSTDDIHRTVVADLRRARHRLTGEHRALANARRTREAAERALVATLGKLRDASHAHVDAQVLYDKVRTALRKRKQELQSTSSSIEAESDRLDALNWCLAGVTQAMKEAAYDVDSRAVETLRSVADVCAAAHGLS